MVDVNLIEVDGRILKRIEENDEAGKRGFDCKRVQESEPLSSSFIAEWDALCPRHMNMERRPPT